MADIIITPPTIGENNDSADPDLRAALAALVAGANAITSEQIAAGAFTAPKVALPSAIQSTTLSGTTWSAGTLRFYKTTHGLVYLVGDIMSTASWPSANTTIGTMPAGYRPGTKIYTHWFQWFAGGAGPYTDSDAVVISIDTDGTMKQLSTVSATFGPEYSLTPLAVSFRAEN